MISILYHSVDEAFARMVADAIPGSVLIREGHAPPADSHVVIVLSAHSFGPHCEAASLAYGMGRLNILAYRPFYLGEWWGTRRDDSGISGECVVAGHGGRFLSVHPEDISDALVRLRRRLGGL